jgi:hypothetical protein
MSDENKIQTVLPPLSQFSNVTHVEDVVSRDMNVLKKRIGNEIEILTNTSFIKEVKLDKESNICINFIGEYGSLFGNCMLNVYSFIF